MLRSVFKIGLASIFLVNAMVAILEPSSFRTMVEPIPILNGLDNNGIMLIGAHDVLLGVLILMGRSRDLLLAWAGLWFLAISVIKLLGLVL